MSIKYRVIYEKRGPAAFIAHRAAGTLIERALRRADVPIRFSEGFHPHARISFGPPLPVGVAGTAEAFDLLLDDGMSPSRLIETVNPCLPEGMRLLRAFPLPPSHPSAQEAAGTARYTIAKTGAFSLTALAALGWQMKETPDSVIMNIPLRNFKHRTLREITGTASVEREIVWEG